MNVHGIGSANHKSALKEKALWARRAKRAPINSIYTFEGVDVPSLVSSLPQGGESLLVEAEFSCKASRMMHRRKQYWQFLKISKWNILTSCIIVDFSKTNIGHFFLKVVVKHPHKLSYHVAFRRLHGLRVLRHVHDPEQKSLALIQ